MGVDVVPALIGCLTAGLVWQFVLILILNGFSLRDLLLQAPSKPDGRHGGRLWLRVAGLLMAYPTRRWRSAWFGIIVHSTQSVVLAAIILRLVLSC